MAVTGEPDEPIMEPRAVATSTSPATITTCQSSFAYTWIAKSMSASR